MQARTNVFKPVHLALYGFAICIVLALAIDRDSKLLDDSFNFEVTHQSQVLTAFVVFAIIYAVRLSVLFYAAKFSDGRAGKLGAYFAVIPEAILWFVAFSMLTASADSDGAGWGGLLMTIIVCASSVAQGIGIVIGFLLSRVMPHAEQPQLYSAPNISQIGGVSPVAQSVITPVQMPEDQPAPVDQTTSVETDSAPKN